MPELNKLESELLLTAKCLVLDLQETLYELDLNIWNATGLAPSGREALTLIRRIDPDWEAFGYLDELNRDEQNEDEQNEDE